MEKYKCQNIITLNWSNDLSVKNLLTKASRMVQPIMIKHKLEVSILSEFYPSNSSLQGLNNNKGQKIEIRCRNPNNKNELYNLDYIIGTLLHELCHNIHGPHNSDFYKLLNQFQNELDEFQSKGIEGTGAGFDMPGQALDTIRHNPISILEAKNKAANSAEKRLQISKIMGNGKLGGNKTNLTPREAAIMAAEKRLKDSISCGNID